MTEIWNTGILAYWLYGILVYWQNENSRRFTRRPHMVLPSREHTTQGASNYKEASYGVPFRGSTYRGPQIGKVSEEIDERST
jgi:hypothetical protein